MVSYSSAITDTHSLRYVLILVVVEDGLVHVDSVTGVITFEVLILVVVEDGLVLLTLLMPRLRTFVLILVVVEDGLVPASPTNLQIEDLS